MLFTEAEAKTTQKALIAFVALIDGMTPYQRDWQDGERRRLEATALAALRKMGRSGRQLNDCQFETDEGRVILAGLEVAHILYSGAGAEDDNKYKLLRNVRSSLAKFKTLTG